MSDITEVDRLNAKIADLKRTIEWLQGRIGITMGVAAQAGIAASTVASVPPVTLSLGWIHDGDAAFNPATGERRPYDFPPAAPSVPAPTEQSARISYLEARLTAMTKWLERNESSVFRRGLWDALNEADNVAPDPLAAASSAEPIDRDSVLEEAAQLCFERAQHFEMARQERGADPETVNVRTILRDEFDGMKLLIRAIKPAASPSPAPAQQQEPSAPTDLSKRLRDYANASWKFSNVLIDKKDLLVVLDEIERYYGGMLAWKRTAEAKDRESVETAAPGASIGDDLEFINLLVAVAEAYGMEGEDEVEEYPAARATLVAFLDKRGAQ